MQEKYKIYLKNFFSSFIFSFFLAFATVFILTAWLGDMGLVIAAFILAARLGYVYNKERRVKARH